MFKLSFMDNNLKEGILLLNFFLEDHFSHIQSIILNIMKSLFIMFLFEYTFIEQSNKLFEEKKTHRFPSDVFVFVVALSLGYFSCLVGLCLLSFGKLASTTLFSALYGKKKLGFAWASSCLFMIFLNAKMEFNSMVNVLAPLLGIQTWRITYVHKCVDVCIHKHIHFYF